MAEADAAFSQVLSAVVPTVSVGRVFLFLLCALIAVAAVYTVAAPPDLSTIDKPGTARLRRLAARMDETLEPAGFNVINACRPAAWQTVFHYHLHVIPRYEDDPLKLPWIPRGADMAAIARVAAEIRGEG